MHVARNKSAHMSHAGASTAHLCDLTSQCMRALAPCKHELEKVHLTHSYIPARLLSTSAAAPGSLGSLLGLLLLMLQHTQLTLRFSSCARSARLPGCCLPRPRPLAAWAACRACCCCTLGSTCITCTLTATQGLRACQVVASPSRDRWQPGWPAELAAAAHSAQLASPAPSQLCNVCAPARLLPPPAAAPGSLGGLPGLLLLLHARLVLLCLLLGSRPGF